MHPRGLRCFSIKYGPIFSVVAPCPRGASPPSVLAVTFTTGCQALPDFPKGTTRFSKVKTVGDPDDTTTLTQPIAGEPGTCSRVRLSSRRPLVRCTTGWSTVYYVVVAVRNQDRFAELFNFFFERAEERLVGKAILVCHLRFEIRVRVKRNDHGRGVGGSRLGEGLAQPGDGGIGAPCRRLVVRRRPAGKRFARIRAAGQVHRRKDQNARVSSVRFRRTRQTAHVAAD